MTITISPRGPLPVNGGIAELRFSSRGDNFTVGEFEKGRQIMLGLGLGVVDVSVRGGLFNPALLFAASEPGVWYDPSDLTTLFQDTAGTVPVTAPGQTVGLMLDKSKGLVLGPELVSDLSGPVKVGDAATTAVYNAVDDSVDVNAATANDGFIISVPGMVTGKVFLVEVDITLGSSTAARVTANSGYIIQDVISSSRTASLILTSDGLAQVRVDSSSATGTFTVTNISVRELPGNHATQPTAAARPTYQVDDGGRGYLSFDGVDDFMVTPTITPGTDKAQVFAGVRKLSDAAVSAMVELSANAGINNGAFVFQAPRSNGVADYSFISRGTGNAIATTTAAFAAPISNVISGLGDISADTAVLRVNGVQRASSVSDQGTGTYLAHPLYIGRRGGTTLPFNGRIYSLIARFGPNLSSDVIGRAETYTAQKTGVTL